MTTTPATLTLAAFLTARLDEDEAAAREASGPDESGRKRSYYSGHGPHRDDWDMWTFHFDPARVLAEVESKRAVLAMLTDLTDDGEWLSREDESDQWLLTKVLRLLALPYADHSDYREEWRP